LQCRSYERSERRKKTQKTFQLYDIFPLTRRDCTLTSMYRRHQRRSRLFGQLNENTSLEQMNEDVVLSHHEITMKKYDGSFIRFSLFRFVFSPNTNNHSHFRVINIFLKAKTPGFSIPLRACISFHYTAPLNHKTRTVSSICVSF